ncbi:HTH-type transcriptional regulator BetI [compost metagenome]|jgi:AcrR family transcriptional regulator|uniref:HTH-type transcriptional regulator PksA n=1 Tax=Pseudomonas wadenswilerensis TaxID=1785161 RepID=A0A380T1I4_9PSED|nr:TetR family transcriptional regulator C-terminal domain-containing protein [Pseudomonas wadenswilerensis]UVM19766.1 TetR family transcriptional regulator C-terminal domain-containing protein [Pseudomonas wadenswilerensis]SUQ63388.1 HTH-type transcriptional regulator PksA [Pseudomonas wadenswilerensis]
MAISREAPARTRRKAGAAVSNNERKRQEVLEATWRAILRVGVENVTIREIAGELQATTGAVVHYFRTKDEVLLYALDHLITGMVEEVTECLEGVEGIARLECILHASLPLDEAGETAWRIWLAFLRTCVGNEKLGAEHQRRYAFMRSALVDELTRLQAQKAIRAGLDLKLEADAMVALADGLGVGRVIDPERFDPEQQRMLVKRHIAAFLTPQA